jgi:hypothetical protein
MLTARCQAPGISFGGFAIDKKSDAFLEQEDIDENNPTADVVVA